MATKIKTKTKITTHKNGTTTIAVTFPTSLVQPLESGKKRLEVFEHQVEGLLKDLYDRGNDELEGIRGRLALPEAIGTLKEKLPARVEDGRKAVEEAFSSDLHLTRRALEAAGIATKNEVETLGKELHKLAKRLDRLQKGEKNTTKRRSSKKTTTRSRARA